MEKKQLLTNGLIILIGLVLVNIVLVIFTPEPDYKLELNDDYIVITSDYNVITVVELEDLEEFIEADNL